jgi:hypothetical protein
MKNILQLVIFVLMLPIMCLGGVFGAVQAAFASGYEYVLALLSEIISD